MKEVNLKYNITAQVLTPLSVGQGEEKDWVEGIDFIVKDGMLWHLDLSKMHVIGIDMNKVANLFQSKDTKGVRLLIGDKLEQISDFKTPMPCQSSNPIKTFFRNQLTNHPVLPGSSLKGAIRSALFAEFVAEKSVSELQHSRTPNADVFGSMKDGSDFMRFVRVGDFEFQTTELINSKIYNLQKPNRDWEGGWKHRGGKEGLTTHDFKNEGFNTIYECLPIGAKAKGNIMLSQLLYEQLCKLVPQQEYLNKKKSLFKNEEFPEDTPIENLMYIINCHTYDYLEKEHAFFTEYQQGEYATNILNNINLLMNEVNDCIDNRNSCIIKLSAGAGFHSITGDWQYEDYTTARLLNMKAGGKLPKSRKIYTQKNGTMGLMGFIKLTFETE